MVQRLKVISNLRPAWKRSSTAWCSCICACWSCTRAWWCWVRASSMLACLSKGRFCTAKLHKEFNDKEWQVINPSLNICPTCLYWFNSRCETLTFVSAPYSTWIFSSVRLFSTSLTSCPSLSLSDSCVMSLEVLPKRNCSNTTWISVNVKSERLLHVLNFDNNSSTYVENQRQ